MVPQVTAPKLRGNASLDSLYLYLTENYKAGILAHEWGLNLMVYVKQIHSEFILEVCCLMSYFIRKRDLRKIVSRKWWIRKTKMAA